MVPPPVPPRDKTTRTAVPAASSRHARSPASRAGLPDHVDEEGEGCERRDRQHALPGWRPKLTGLRRLAGRLEFLCALQHLLILGSRTPSGVTCDHPQDDRRDDRSTPPKGRKSVLRERKPEPEDERPDEAHASMTRSPTSSRVTAESTNLSPVNPARAPPPSDTRLPHALPEHDPLVDVRQRPGRDDEDPEEHHRRHQRERAQFVERHDPVVEAHAAILNLLDAIGTGGLLTGSGSPSSGSGGCPRRVTCSATNATGSSVSSSSCPARRGPPRHAGRRRGGSGHVVELVPCTSRPSRLAALVRVPRASRRSSG